MSNLCLEQKSPWTKICLDNCPLDKSPLDICLLGQLLQCHKQAWTDLCEVQSQLNFLANLLLLGLGLVLQLY